MNNRICQTVLFKGTHVLLAAALAAGLALGVGPVRTARAATFTVNSTLDAVDANPGDGLCASATGECTLRAAIMEANALAGDDTINLPAGTYTLTIVGAGEDAASTGDLDITSNLIINGADAASTFIDGNRTDRVLHITGAFAVDISGVTVTGGFGQVPFSPQGGGIFIAGGATTRVSNSIIRENSSNVQGGGILNGTGSTLLLTNSSVISNGANSGGGLLNLGNVTVNNSNFRGNATSGITNGGGAVTLINTIVSGNLTGPGIENSGGTLTVTNSTISGNMTADIGAIRNFGTATLYNVTVSNNSGSATGGILNLGTMILSNSTVTNNTSEFGGGGVINFDGGTLALRNTILAGNFGPASFPDCSGTLNSEGYNLNQNIIGCTIVGDTTGNLIGVDPLLGPLQDNGGPTFTHALLPGSPAIDAGNPAAPGSGGNACEATDQRGVARPQGARCDIGAFEAETPA